MASKQNPRIEVKEGAFYIDGKPTFLYSGEIHYFRMPEKSWKIHLKRAREAGLNCVSSYVPWSWHESEEGNFDFVGKTHPQKNLIRFLHLVKDSGLYFSARIGPVSNAELVHEGIPGWLLKNNPDIYVQRNGINNLPHAMLLSYLSPKFQSYVQKWYDQVLPVVAARQIHLGGPIAMVQLCNEIAMIHWLHKASDRSEFVNRMYREFLKEKYQDLSKLNAVYRQNYRSFEEILQPEGDVLPQTLAIFFDWALFYRRYYALYYHSLYKRARDGSITVPLSANAPQFYDYDVRGRGVFSPMTTSMYRDFPLYSPNIVFGGAYQMRRLDFENFHDVAITSEMTKLLEPRAPTICAELQTGIMRDRPRLYPSDVDLNIQTSVAHGLNGLNCYMFSSGQNLSGMGAFGAYHDWQAPVSLDGKVKEHFSVIKRWGGFLRRYGRLLAKTKKVSDTSIGFYLPYYATEYYSGPWTSHIESFRTNFFYDGFARLLQLAGYNFSFADLMKENQEELSKRKSLCVFSLEFMDEETQRKLAVYVERGGKLLIGPKMPAFDLAGKSCQILLQSLSLKFQEQTEKMSLLWNGAECWAEFPIQIFSCESARTMMTTLEGRPCVLKGAQGKGQWLAYGVSLSHMFNFHVDIVREWMKALGIRPQLFVEPWDVHAVVRWAEDSGIVFLFNYHEVPKKGKVRLILDEPVQSRWSGTFAMEGRSAKRIPLKLTKNILMEASK